MDATAPERAPGAAPAPGLFPPLRIGPLTVTVPVGLAPMAGVTNASFRRLCREQGESALPASLRPGAPGPLRAPDGSLTAPAGLYVTEMVTTRALVERRERTLAMVRPDPAERVRSVQLYGVDPVVVGQAVRILVEEDLADHIDLNFGCPVPKVTRRGGGAALPWKRDLLAAILRETVRAAEAASRAARRDVPVPVTMKMRIGIDPEHETFLEAGRTAQDAGIAAVTLHARTAREHYSGHAHWERVAALKEAVDIPVLGNGDVWTGDDAAAMMRSTGADGVVVGRGCQGRPWLLADIVHALTGSGERARPDLDAVLDTLRQHARLLVAELGEDRGVRDLRKHVGWYLRGYPVGGAGRAALARVGSLAGLEAALEQVRSGLPRVVPYPGKAVEGPRGRAGAPRRPHLPDGWLDSPYLSPDQRALLGQAESDASGG